MNAVEILEQVRAHEADLAIVDDRLVLSGWAQPLPEELRDAITAHRAELMIALGAPIDRTVASILADIRPHLPKALKRLPDDHLLVLVNWSIIAAWEKAVRTVTR